MSVPPDGFDGFVRYRDFAAHAQAEADARFALEGRLMQRIDRNADRINSLEGVIDQQRGAKALAYFLIGSNLLALAAFLLHR